MLILVTQHSEFFLYVSKWYDLFRDKSNCVTIQKYYLAIHCIAHTEHFMPWFIYFVSGNVCLTVSPTHVSSPLTSPLAFTCLFSVSVTLFLFCYVWPFIFLFLTHKQNHIVFVFLGLISLNILPSSSIHGVTNCKISFFLVAK